MAMYGRKTLEARVMKDSISEVYKGIAHVYDLWGKLTESKARRRCLELSNIRNGESVLEVAVGTGLAFAEILKINPGGRNEGIDITEAMLVKAIKKAERLGTSNYRLKVGDAYNLEFSESTFDIVINNYMFDLLPEKDFTKILSEFRRVLRPRGRLVLVNMAKGEYWYNHVWDMIYRLHPATVGGCRGVDLLPYVASSGFRETRREFISQLTFPSEIVYGVKPP